MTKLHESWPDTLQSSAGFFVTVAPDHLVQLLFCLGQPASRTPGPTLAVSLTFNSGMRTDT
jgi:hypothetical protein